ncbi:hypothetical protein [Alloactinosynnema sp. L-07]|nr:hypothetical protein [Alloactinosynnema sp. L-07]
MTTTDPVPVPAVASVAVPPGEIIRTCTENLAQHRRWAATHVR